MTATPIANQPILERNSLKMHAKAMAASLVTAIALAVEVVALRNFQSPFLVGITHGCAIGAVFKKVTPTTRIITGIATGTFIAAKALLPGVPLIWFTGGLIVGCSLLSKNH